MDLKVDPEVYEKFCEIKARSSSKSLSDSHFLSTILSNIESCTCDFASNLFNCDNAEERVLISKLCPECSFSAPSVESLRLHFESVHTDTGSFSCTCGVAYVRLADFLLHYTNCPVAATDLQEPRFGSSQKRRKRSSSSSKCDTETPTENSNEHCDNSPETYHSYRHPSVSPVAGPSKDKPFGCPKCLKGFKSKSLLEQHMHLHYPPRYKCRWCGNVYRWPPVYYHHKQKCKNRPVTSGASVSAPQREEQPVFPTKLDEPSASNESFAQAQKALAQFLNYRNPVLPPAANETCSQPPPVTNGALQACPMTCICTEVFPNFQSYFKHAVSCPGILSASSLFESLVPRPLGVSSHGSANSLFNGADLIDQEKSAIEDLSSFKEETSQRLPGYNGIFSCSICGKDFNSKLSLKQHVDGKHRAEGKYLCRTCGKRYRWGASFYYHRRTCVAAEETNVVTQQSTELLTSNI